MWPAGVGRPLFRTRIRWRPSHRGAVFLTQAAAARPLLEAPRQQLVGTVKKHETASCGCSLDGPARSLPGADSAAHARAETVLAPAPSGAARATEHSPRFHAAAHAGCRSTQRDPQPPQEEGPRAPYGARVLPTGSTAPGSRQLPDVPPGWPVGRAPGGCPQLSPHVSLCSALGFFLRFPWGESVSLSVRTRAASVCSSLLSLRGLCRGRDRTP